MTKFRPTTLSPELLKLWDEADAKAEASMQRIAELFAPFHKPANPDQHQGYCKRKVWVEEGRVWLSNVDDRFDEPDFINREEVEALISELRAAADEAWPND